MLKIITAYRPCDKRNSSGTQNTFHQHRHHLLKINRDVNPRQALLQDLTATIKSDQDRGVNVILMMDCNEDIQSQTMQAFLEDCGLQNVLTQQHKGQLPATRKGGKLPIDGIFASWAIQAVASGICCAEDGVEGPRADHRCLWLDVSLENIFGLKIPKLPPKIENRCNSRDPRVYNKYNQLLVKHLEEHHLEEKIFKLERDAIYPLPLNLQIEAERIDKLYMQGHSFADKRCRKLKTGGTPYTPEFTALLAEAMFFKLLGQHKRNQNWKVSDRVLCKYMKRADITQPLRGFKLLEEVGLYQKLKDAHKKIREYRKIADAKRSFWLEELAEARAVEEAQLKVQKDVGKGKKRTTTGSATEKELRLLKARESTRKHFKKIKSALGHHKMTGLSLVEEPTGNDIAGNTIWTERVNKEEIEAACMRENEKRFTQARNTPFNKGKLGLQMGKLGTTKYSDQILQGNFQISEDMDQPTRKVLEKLQQKEANKAFPKAGISTKEYRAGWEKMKERTGAAPSGLNFGQCKATAKNERVSAFMAAHASIPWKSGYAYSRWKRGMNIEIPKKANSRKVSELRTIVLMDSQFNFGNKVMSRRISQEAEKYKGFAEEQFGSRKKHRAIEHALNKKLTFDLMRINKQPMALCANDLKSCYDRINHAFASLCLQTIGMTKPEVTCMFGTLQEMKHHIRTAYGDSEHHFGGNEWKHTCSSIYQGNGAGPIIWAAVSSPLLEVLKEQGFGISIHSAISQARHNFSGYMFVDDLDLVQTGQANEDGVAVAQRMQNCIDYWEKLVKISGGALNINKCAWWMIDFEWQDDGSWNYKTMGDIPRQLTAIDYDEVRKQITRKEVDEAFETLGVVLAPNGDETSAIKRLIQKGNKWADAIRVSSLSQAEALTALQTTILKTIEYPLSVLNINQETNRKIMKPILMAGLAKSGLVRYFNRALLHGPRSHLGLQIADVQFTSITNQMEILCRHGPTNSMTGKILRAAIEALKVEIGWGGNLFDIPYEAIKELGTECWIKTLAMEMKKYKIQVSENTGSLSPKRQRDRILMECFWEEGYRGSKLRILNKCRLWMKATTMADLITGNGRKVLPGILQGIRPGLQIACEKFPAQGRINNKGWEVWNQALKKVFKIRRDDEMIHPPLGHWLSENREWQCWQDTTNLNIYFRKENKWEKRSNLRGLVGQENFPILSEEDSLPDTVLPAIGWSNEEGNFRFFGSAPIILEEEGNPTSMEEFIGQLPPRFKWAIGYISIPVDITPVSEALWQGTAFAVTDGSYKLNRGTAAFTIQSQRYPQEGIVGSNNVMGPEKLQCAYRSELAGILGTLITIWGVCEVSGITTGNITIGCDNQQAGKQGIEAETFPDIRLDHFDILRLIHEVRGKLPITVNYQYIEAHQLEKYPTRQLDYWAQWNERMDQMAKARWEQTTNWELRNMEPNQLPWVIFADGNPIVRKVSQSLKTFLSQNRLKNGG